MLYWHIAFWFFACCFAGCIYSMCVHEEDFSVFHGIIERAGVCFVLAVAWPLSLLAAISLAISGFFMGSEYE